MKTKLIIVLLSLNAINVMGQTNGTITHKKTNATKITTSANTTKKTTSSSPKTSAARSSNKPSAPSPTLGSSNYTPRIETFYVNGISFQMVEVQGGSFIMGATSEQEYNTSDKSFNEDQTTVPQRVNLNSYFIGKYEVTQLLWKAVMNDKPSFFKGKNLPVETICWSDCQKFINRLNSLTGKNFRLPTEAEWEFAARGGTKSKGYKYSGSNNLGNVAWYDMNGSRTTHPVGMKSPNELGIYDMSGNVWEYCQDWYSHYSSEGHVVRGGSWNNEASSCQSSLRDGDSCVKGSVGLRLALSE